MKKKNIHGSLRWSKLGERESNLMAQSTALVENVLYQDPRTYFCLEHKNKRSADLALENLQFWLRR